MNRRSFKLGLLCTCWLPPLLVLIALCVQTLRVVGKETEYVARAKILVPQGAKAMFSRPQHSPPSELVGMVVEVIESDEIRRRAVVRIHAEYPELKKVPVEMHATGNPNSSVVKVVARGTAQKYTKVLLSAVLDEFMAFSQEQMAKSVGSEIVPGPTILVPPQAAVPEVPDLVGPLIEAGALAVGVGLGVMLAAGLIAGYWR